MGLDVYHGTYDNALKSIATFGLLSREKLERMNRVIIYPDYTKEGCIYVTKTAKVARDWAEFYDCKRYGNPIVLVLHLTDEEQSLLAKDENMCSEVEFELWKTSFPSSRIDVFVSNGRHMPIRKYVDRYIRNRLLETKIA